MSVASMMLALFMFFFTLPVLWSIAKFTNQKAEEVVNKVKCTGENGRVYYKVTLTNANAHTLTCTFTQIYGTYAGCL